MATITQPKIHHNTFDFSEARSMQWVVPIGRFLFSFIFIFSGLMNHFQSGTITYAANNGVPMASLLVPFSGLLAIIGGLSIVLGYYARIGALLIIVFLIPVTLFMHAFWAVPEPQMAQMQMINFMKNVGLLGGAILIAYFGSGPLSLGKRY